MMNALAQQSDLAYQHCVEVCREQEAQGVAHFVSCEHGCGTVAPRTGPAVKTGPLIVTQVEKPDCPWYMTARQFSNNGAEGQAYAQVVMWETGCYPNWWLIGGIGAIAALLLLGRNG